MGGNTFGARDWAQYNTYQQTTAHTSAPQQIFKANSVHPDLDPQKFKIRESRHSAANPHSTPIVLGLDVTGSMGDIAVDIAKNGLGVLIKEIFDRKPVTDPHIAFAAIGDVHDYRDNDFQFSQFEADITILEQLQKIWISGGGGGNGSESYTLAWHLCAYHTVTDAYEKDGRKGFIFTFGDDGVPPSLTQDQLLKTYGRNDEIVCSNEELLEQVSKMYNVFHLMIERGTNRDDRVRKSWEAVLGERAIPLTDYKKLSEVIVSIMQVVAGADKDTVVQSWSGGTGLVVANALKNMPSTAVRKAGSVRF